MGIQMLLRRKLLLVTMVLVVIVGLGYLLCPRISGNGHSGRMKNQQPLIYQYANIITAEKPTRVVLIGAGPTTLGALYRLYDIGVLSYTKIQVIVFEKESESGGVAAKLGGVMPDNKEEFILRHNDDRPPQTNNYLDIIASGDFREMANVKQGETAGSVQGGVAAGGSYLFMMDNSSRILQVHQPVPDCYTHLLNGMLHKVDLQCLCKTSRIKDSEGIESYNDWLVGNFGRGLCDLIMRKYNRKLWGVDTRKISSDWVKDKQQDDMYKGNITNTTTTQYSRIQWKKLTEALPQGWFHYNNKVTKVNIDKKQITVVRAKDKKSFKLSYDMLISTAPLNWLVNNIQSNRKKEVVQMGNLGQQLSYIRMHIVVLKVDHLPHAFRNKSSIYFLDTDTPFHRVLINSPTSVHHKSSSHTKRHIWSLICEISQPIGMVNSAADADQSSTANTSDYWTEDYLVKNTVAVLKKYGFLNKTMRISQNYYQFDGYPIPTILNNRILAEIQPWLESYSIFSRGLLGGWRSEVGREDQSFTQGVEIVNRLLLGLPEETYPCKLCELSNKKTAKNTTHPFSKAMNKSVDYEFVIAHYRENLDWLKGLQLTRYTHIYNKKIGILPDFDFQYWTDLPNVGREAHTYLYHIVTNYNHLANVTVFLQGQLRGGELKRCYARDLFQYVTEARMYGLGYAASEMFSDWNMAKHIHRSYVKQNRIHDDSVGEYWNRYFEFPHPKEIITNYYGCFSVTRERILRRPRKVYKQLMESLSYARNPQEGYIVEKLWVSLFSAY